MLHRYSVRTGLQTLFVLTAGLLFLFVAGQANAQGPVPDLSVQIEVVDDGNVRVTSGPFDPPPNTVYAGQELVYRVGAYNRGPDPATNVTIQVTLPGNEAFSGDPVSRYLAASFLFCDLTATSPAHIVTCDLGDMEPFAYMEFEIKTLVVFDAVAGEADGAIATSAFASISSDELDPELDNNLDNADQFVQDLADLTVWKIAESGTVNVGEQFTYTIVIENQGPSSAMGMQLIDDLFADEAVTVLDFAASHGEPVPTTCGLLPATPEYPNPRLECSHYAPLEPVRTGNPGSGDGRLTITVRAIANEATTVTNRVRVFTGPVFHDPDNDAYGSDNGTPDPDPSNNVALAVTTVEDMADLEVTKRDSPDPVLAGEQLNYTVRFTNTGPSAAENVVLRDNLPSEVEIVSVSASSGSCNAGTPGNPLDPTTCTFDTVPHGGSRTMTVVAQVKPDAVTDPTTDEKIIHNDAWVSSGTFDPDNSNNLATEATTVQAKADMVVQKFSEGPFPWKAGEERTYLVNVWNNGPSRSQHVEVLDQLPLQVEFLRAYIEFEVQAGGTPLPCSLTSDNTVICPLGDLMPSPLSQFPPGARAYIDVFIKPDVPDGTVLTNVVDVLADTPDPKSQDNRATREDRVVAEADLEIKKWSEPDKVLAGEQKKYTIWVRNNGPSDALNVVVTDLLPAEVAYEMDTSSCALTGIDQLTGGQILTCSAGTLGPGETRQFDVWALVDPATEPGTTITNTVEVVDANGPGDPDQSNNLATTKNLVLGQADLRINKFGKPDGEVRAGENLTYTIVVDNLGPGYAHTVVITDLIQSSGSFELVWVDSDRPATCDPVSGVFNQQLQLRCVLTDALEVLAPDATGRWIVTVVVRADEAQDINNLATVLSADLDPDTDNNQAIVQHAITDVADLSIRKSAEGQVMAAGGAVSMQADAVTAGLDVTYTLVISNYGPSTAENVVVYDLVAGWLDIQGTSASQGACDSGEGGKVTCALGSLAPGTGATVFIRASVAAWLPGGSQLKNDAQVVSDVFDANNSNNLASNGSDVSAWADLSIDKVQAPVVVLPGGEIEYTVTVSNAGPSDAAFAMVSDLVPAGISNVAWQCTALGEATCPTGGTGDIYHTVGLPAGWQLVYKITGQRNAETISWIITNTASVTTTEGLNDPNLANNEARAANRPFRSYLPQIRSARGNPNAPDLRIVGLTATSSQVEIIVTNYGSRAVTSPFWVDVYLDPAEAPSAAGQTWPELAFRGLAWGVPIEALPLYPAESITLTVGGSYYHPALSEVHWPLAVGTEVYAQVDSFGSPPYAAVVENHELAETLYNNIAGPILSTQDAGALPVVDESPPASIGLPSRR